MRDITFICEQILEKNGSQLLKGEEMNEWISRQKSTEDDDGRVSGN